MVCQSATPNADGLGSPAAERGMALDAGAGIGVNGLFLAEGGPIKVLACWGLTIHNHDTQAT